MVVLDEVRGFEDRQSRGASMLREWKKLCPTLFVLAVAGTLFGACATNACNFMHNLGYLKCEPECNNIVSHLRKRYSPHTTISGCTPH